MMTARRLLLALLLVAFAAQAPAQVRRVPAEWEPQAAVWLQWPKNWEGSYRLNFNDIVDALQEYVPVALLQILPMREIAYLKKEMTEMDKIKAIEQGIQCTDREVDALAEIFLLWEIFEGHRSLRCWMERGIADLVECGGEGEPEVLVECLRKYDLAIDHGLEDDFVAHLITAGVREGRPPLEEWSHSKKEME